MTEQISAKSMNTGAAYVKTDAHGGVVETGRQAGEVPGQARAVVAVREQFNPLGAGLRSIWPQSVVGF
ncbi:hypothetical protein FQP90_17400 [Paenarthrobacter nitroguajacolicus]|uniref:Uncharacterized protein n=1 Tax=Paenarthrobacter nitroguajacolicus TaxID=211146 RepID=A0A558GTI7_PAENT|nr:hypothetical protein [Paenarthrobacter nitroguajacolicus]TVU60163.1 hypothetical protein FQP90_17400 [Paenarthrobacter nitroguajacolicus]